jgi:hypothetical protein
VSERGNRWLFGEAVALLFVPGAMLVCALPVMIVGLLQAVFPAGHAGWRPELLFGLLPYPCAAFGLWSAWRYARALAQGEGFRLDGWFVLAVVAAGFASWQIVATTEAPFSLLLCGPPWLLAVHLAVLRWRIGGPHRRVLPKPIR